MDARHDHYWLNNYWRPSRVTPANIRTNIIFLETSIIDLHFAADSACLSSFEFFWQAPKEYFISARVTFRPFKDVQGREFGANRKRIYDFLLVRHSNLGPTLHRFGDIADYFCAPDPTPIPPQFRGCSRCTRSPISGSARTEGLSYSAVKLFLKYSNRCEKHTSTSRTDRRTDDLLWHNRALRSIAR